MAALGDENVGRLDVAMDDPLAVRLGEGFSDLDSQLDHRSLFIGSAPMACLSVWPSSSSIAMKGLPSFGSTS